MALRQRGAEWEEYDKAVRWMAMTMIITLVITLLLTVFSLPLAYLIEQGISKKTIASVKMFLSAIQEKPSFLFQQYYLSHNTYLPKKMFYFFETLTIGGYP